MLRYKICLDELLMNGFDANDFARRLQAGEFDNALNDTIEKLTTEQLREIALLVFKRPGRP